MKEFPQNKIRLGDTNDGQRKGGCYPHYWPYRLCLLSALLILSLPSIAHATPTEEESRSFALGKVAFDDGLFDLAQQRLQAYSKRYPLSELRPNAQILTGRALYYLGRFNLASSALESPLPGDVSPTDKAELLFWQAESLLAFSHYKDAEERYLTLRQTFPQSDRVAEADLGRAWALIKLDRNDEADKLLHNLANSQEKPEVREAAALLIAKREIVERKFKEAAQHLQALLDSKPSATTLYETWYLLAEVDIALERPGDALLAYEKVTTDDSAFPREVVANAWYGKGRAERVLQKLPEAMASFERAFDVAASEPLQLSALRSYLATARDRQSLPEAIAKLQEFSKKHKDKGEPGPALYAISMALAENNQTAKAIDLLDSSIRENPQATWRASAWYQLAKLYQQPDASLIAGPGSTADNSLALAQKALDRCLEASNDPQLSQLAQSERANLFLRQNKPAEAQAEFEKLAATGTGPVAEEAGYQLLQLLAGQGKLDLFNRAEEKFLANWPKTSYHTSLALLQGELLERLGQLEQARTTYEKAIASTEPSPRESLLLLRLGDLLFKSGDIRASRQTYQTLLAQYPEDFTVPEAASKLALDSLSLQAITDEKAIEDLFAVWKKFPRHPGAPHLLFQIGELYFDRGDFVNAQSSFEQISRDYPQSDLADDALYWGGVSSLNHGDLAEALKILQRIPDGSSFKTDSRLLQARIFHKLLKFSNAIALFDAVAAQEKSGPRFVEATLRKGDGHFALGDKETDSAHYEQAAAAYGLLINGTQGTPAQRSEAAFKRARTLEKLGRKSDALALYLDILGARVQTPPGTPGAGIEPAPLSTPSTAAAPPPSSSSPSPAPMLSAAALAPPRSLVPPGTDLYWVTRSAFEAGRIKEELQDWRGAITIYKRLEQLGGPNEQEFHEMILRLRRNHYIYE